MSRPRMYLTPWPLVAAVYNLEVLEDLRPGPMVSAGACLKIFQRAMRKMDRELARQGITRDTVEAYFRLRDEGAVRIQENIAALLPAPSPTHDDADPSPVTSLHKVS